MSYQTLLEKARSDYKKEKDPSKRKAIAAFGRAIKSKMAQRRITIKDVEEAML